MRDLASLFIRRVVLRIAPEKRNAHLDFYSRASFDNSELSSYFAIIVSQLPYNAYFFSLVREPYLNRTYRSFATSQSVRIHTLQASKENLA